MQPWAADTHDSHSDAQLAALRGTGGREGGVCARRGLGDARADRLGLCPVAARGAGPAGRTAPRLAGRLLRPAPGTHVRSCTPPQSPAPPGAHLGSFGACCRTHVHSTGQLPWSALTSGHVNLGAPRGQGGTRQLARGRGGGGSRRQASRGGGRSIGCATPTRSAAQPAPAPQPAEGAAWGGGGVMGSGGEGVIAQRRGACEPTCRSRRRRALARAPPGPESYPERSAAARRTPRRRAQGARRPRPRRRGRGAASWRARGGWRQVAAGGRRCVCVWRSV